MLKFHGSKTKEVFLYTLCGGSATLVDISILAGLELLSSFSYTQSSALAFSIAAIVKYWLLSRLILRHYQRRKVVVETICFAAISIVGLIVNQIVISAYSESMLPVSKATAILVVMAWNYLMQKLCMFNRPEANKAKTA